jgi:hypothetical protein
MKALRANASTSLFTGMQAHPRVAEELHRDHNPNKELFAWFGVAVIVGVFALAMYILWARAASGF